MSDCSGDSSLLTGGFYESEDSESHKGMPATKDSLSFLGSLFIALNVCFGTGIIGVAGSFTSCGVGLGVVLFAVMGFVNYQTICIVLTLCHDHQCDGLDRLVSKCLGRFFGWIYSIIGVLALTHVLVAYIVHGMSRIVVWVGETDVDVSSGWKYMICTFGYGVLVCGSLSSGQSLRFIGMISPVVVLLIFFFAASVCYRSGFELQSRGISPTIVVAVVDLDIISVLLTYTVAYSLSLTWPTSLSIYRGSLNTRKLVVRLAFGICFIMTAVPSTIGYIVFGQDTKSSILDNFGEADMLMSVVKGGFFVIVSLSFPIIQMCHASLWTYMLFGDDFVWRLHGWRKALVLVITVGVPVVIASFIEDLHMALGVVASICRFVVGYAIPGIMYVKWATGPYLIAKRIGGVFLSALGLIGALFAGCQSLSSMLDHYRK